MKKLNRAVMLLFLIGCVLFSFRLAPAFAAKNEIVVPEPIVVNSDETETITFRRVVIRILAGTRVGTVYDGLLRVPQYNLIWQSNLSLGSEEFNLTTSEVLKYYNYNVLGGDDVLFDDSKSYKARYQLGCIITSMMIKAYAPLAGNFGDTTMTAEWQLFDTKQDKIIYKNITTGQAKEKGTAMISIVQAYRNALKGLLADSKFVDLVRKKNDAPAGNDFAPLSIPIPNNANPMELNLPGDLERLLKSVVIINVGATTASGVVISPDGYILTAAHVVEGVKEVQVGFKSGISLPAQVVREDVSQDIALIKIPGSGYDYLRMVEDPPAVGSDLYAIGSPAGKDFAFSISKGIVSGQRVWKDFPYIQTDASLSPGYSGGPMVDPQGRIIGIISWKIVAPGFEGLSFGVPVKAILKSLNLVLQAK